MCGGRRRNQSRPARERIEYPNLFAAAPCTEDISFCDVVLRLCPELSFAGLLARVEEDARQRRERVRRLEERLRRGSYDVPAAAVAHSLLRELDPGWLA